MEKEELKNDPLFHLFEIIKTRKIKMLLGFAIVFAMTLVGVFLVMPSAYEASTKVGLSLPIIPKGGDVVPYLEELRDLKSFVANQPLVASSRVIYEKAVVALNLHKAEKKRSFFGKLKNLFIKEKEKDPLTEAIDELYRITNVYVVRGTNIIQFSARSGSPEAAAQIANTLAKTYIDHENNLMASRAQMAYDIISGELESARNSLNTAQNASDGLKRSRNAADDPVIIRQRLATYTVQYEQIKEKIETLESQPPRPKTVEVKKVRSGKASPVQPTESPKVKELRSNLKKLKDELEADLGRYTEKHPTVVKLRKKIAALEEELSKAEKAAPLESPQPIVETEVEAPSEPAVSAGADLDELKIKRDSLSKLIQSLEGRLSRASAIGVDSEKSSRDVNLKELEYLAVKEKLEHARMLRDQTREGPIKIIDPAAPPAHASMKKKVILLVVGFMASVIFGIATGFVSEYYEDAYKTAEEVEKSLNLPVLATIPRVSKTIGNEKSRLKFPSNRSKRDGGSDRQEIRM